MSGFGRQETLVGKVSLLFLNAVSKMETMCGAVIWWNLAVPLLSFWMSQSLPAGHQFLFPLYSLLSGRRGCWVWLGACICFCSSGSTGEVMAVLKEGWLSELPVRFQGLACPLLVFFFKMFVSLIHISNNFIEPSYPTLSLWVICHLNILIQNVLCSGFLYMQNSELISPTHFWRTFLLLHR